MTTMYTLAGMPADARQALRDTLARYGQDTSWTIDSIEPQHLPQLSAELITDTIKLLRETEARWVGVLRDKLNEHGRVIPSDELESDEIIEWGHRRHARRFLEELLVSAEEILSVN